ncbi:uncharacterized protein LOC134276726 [Saccostrea cucullata]|uniref:uncharacterized protein LOC134276726 n=1 Tax=Saccostrea cuccullata TaxID=36930 RepID=UPI002ED469D4
MKEEMKAVIFCLLLSYMRASEIIEILTQDDMQYVKLSTHCITAAERSFFTFEVKAIHNAHFALMSADDDNEPLYEIVLGGWENSISCIRLKKQGICYGTELDQVLQESSFKTFWVYWLNGNITVGLGNTHDGNIFMNYFHSTPYPVKYFAVMTGFGSTGHWKFKNDVRCNFEVFNNTKVVENNTNCHGSMKYECHRGFYLYSGNLKRTCLNNRTWSREPPYCKRILCPQLTSTTSYKIQHQDTYVGGNVTVACSNNFRHFSGNLTRKCALSGLWEGEEPVCLRCKCPCSLTGQQKFNSSTGLEQRIEQRKKELTILKNSTNSFYRKKISASDNRPSSAGLGYLFGCGVILFIILSLVISDMPKFYRHVRFGAD